MKSVKFTERIKICCSPEAAFDFTQDYNSRLKWDTFLVRAELIEGAFTAAKGVKAYCVAKNGLGMVTEYVSFNRPKVTAIQMTEGPFMFKSFQGSWTFTPLGVQGTEVKFIYSFSLRFPFNLVPFVIKTTLKRNVRRRLADLKECLEKQGG